MYRKSRAVPRMPVRSVVSVLLVLVCAVFLFSCKKSGAGSLASSDVEKTPVMTVDGEVYGKCTPESAVKIIDSYYEEV